MTSNAGPKALLGAQVALSVLTLSAAVADPRGLVSPLRYWSTLALVGTVPLLTGMYLVAHAADDGMRLPGLVESLANILGWIGIVAWTAGAVGLVWSVDMRLGIAFAAAGLVPLLIVLTASER